jgi:hypothetical protein
MKKYYCKAAVFAVVLFAWSTISRVEAQLSCPGAEQISIGLSATAPTDASREPAVPPIGDFIVFSSKASNLSSSFIVGTSSNSPNIYRYSPSGGIALLSSNTDGIAPEKNDGDDLNFGSLAPSVSKVRADGSYAVAFQSDAIDLVSFFSNGAVNGGTQVFLRLLASDLPPSNQTRLISKSANATGQELGANGLSDQATVALISEDPIRYRVCFRSDATDLVLSQDDPGAIYCRTATVTGQGISLGNTTILKANPLDGTLSRPMLSADGAVVAFESNATIVDGKPSSYQQIYTYSFTSQTFNLISANAAGMPAVGVSEMPSISGDGAVVMFRYSGEDLGGQADLKGFEGTQKTLLVRHQVSTGANSQVNTDVAGIPSNGTAHAGRIDSSGRYAVFSDNGTNLAVGATGDVFQVYLKDTTTGDIVRTSVTAANQAGSEDSGFNSNSSFAPPLAVGQLDSSGTVPFATFISVAPNLASVGNPSSVVPFLFRSLVETATPTPTPTATPTPRVLTKNIRISEPPEVEILQRRSNGTYDLLVVCELFRLDPSVFKSSDELVELLAKKKARLTYVVEIRKAGSNKRTTRISTRNIVTIRKLTPGRYNVRYKVVATRGKKQIQSRVSPRTTITLT